MSVTEMRPCPLCSQPREVRVQGPAMAVRTCPDCGDQKVMRARDLRGQEGRRCRRCANRPKARGRKSTPRDDIDEVMVDRLMGGRSTGSNVAERLEAAARLIGLYRLPAPLVAQRIGVSGSTVDRYKRELRATGRLAA